MGLLSQLSEKGWVKTGGRYLLGPQAGVTTGNVYRKNANHSGRNITYRVNQDGLLHKL